MKKIKCAGGDDEAEDIRGGIKQMVKNLKWSKNFKIAMLICDAPTHGTKYSGDDVSDFHPNEDIKDAIEMLIANEILLIAILFTEETFIMFDEIKLIYKNKGREDLLMYADLTEIEKGYI